MKTTIRICTLAIACSAGIAYSQNAGGGERMAEFIKKIDANGDGKITKEEFLNHFKKEAEERFAKVDANADGTLDEAEIKAVGEKMREGGMRRGGGEGRPGSESGGFRRPPGAEGSKEKAPEGGARPEGRRPEGGPRPEGAPEGRRPQGGPEGRRPEGAPGGPGGPGGGMFMSPEERFKKMDKNGDGSVDPAEMREYAASEADANFKRMDENGDGKISLDEMKKVGERLRNAMRGGEGGMRRPPGAEGGPGAGGPPGGAGGSGGFRRPPGDEAPPAK